MFFKKEEKEPSIQQQFNVVIDNRAVKLLKYIVTAKLTMKDGSVIKDKREILPIQLHNPSLLLGFSSSQLSKLKGLSKLDSSQLTYVVSNSVLSKHDVEQFKRFYVSDLAEKDRLFKITEDHYINPTEIASVNFLAEEESFNGKEALLILKEKQDADRASSEK